MSTTVNSNTVRDVAAWHAMTQAEVVKRLATNPEKGLNLSETAARLQKYGPNRLPEGRKRGPFARFFAQFNNILIYVLLAAGFAKIDHCLRALVLELLNRPYSLSCATREISWTFCTNLSSWMSTSSSQNRCNSPTLRWLRGGLFRIWFGLGRAP